MTNTIDVQYLADFKLLTIIMMELSLKMSTDSDGGIKYIYYL